MVDKLQLTEDRAFEIALKHMSHLFGVKIAYVELAQAEIGTKKSAKLIVEGVDRLRSYAVVFREIAEKVSDDPAASARKFRSLVGMILNTADKLITDVKAEQEKLQRGAEKYDELLSAAAAIKLLDFDGVIALSKAEKAERVANIPNLTTLNYLAGETNMTDVFSNRIVEGEFSKFMPDAVERQLTDSETVSDKAFDDSYEASGAAFADDLISVVQSNLEPIFVDNSARKLLLSEQVPRLCDKLVTQLLKKQYDTIKEEIESRLT